MSPATLWEIWVRSQEDWNTLILVGFFQADTNLDSDEVRGMAQVTFDKSGQGVLIQFVRNTCVNIINQELK